MYKKGAGDVEELLKFLLIWGIVIIVFAVIALVFFVAQFLPGVVLAILGVLLLSLIVAAGFYAENF